jgi:hypothetical protein
MFNAVLGIAVILTSLFNVCVWFVERRHRDGVALSVVGDMLSCGPRVDSRSSIRLSELQAVAWESDRVITFVTSEGSLRRRSDVRKEKEEEGVSAGLVVTPELLRSCHLTIRCTGHRPHAFFNHSCLATKRWWNHTTLWALPLATLSLALLLDGCNLPWSYFGLLFALANWPVRKSRRSEASLSSPAA